MTHPRRLARAARADLSRNPDRQLGEQALARGLVTPEQLEALIDAAAFERAGGTSSSLAALLLRQRLVTAPQLIEMLRDMQGDPFSSDRRAGAAEPHQDVIHALEQPDQMVGHYVRTELLGKGAMGEIWKAWDLRLARWVAIKFLQPEVREAFTRFIREARLAGRLNHPNIVAVYDVGDHEGSPYIVMQHVEGGKPPRGPMPDERAARIVHDAARAVQTAHDCGVVHRDIKPGNLLVDAMDRVFVTDFGVARDLNDSMVATTPGTVVGTPAYMSPEQAAGKRDQIGAPTDIFSLGATLFELCTGRPPYVGPSFMDLVARATMGDAPTPRSVRRRIPVEVESIIMKAMEPEPKMRYATARDLADDLKRWLDGQTIEAKPLALTARWIKRVRRRPLEIALLGAAVALALVVASMTFLRYRESRRLGTEGAALTDQGQWDVAKEKLERSLALWEQPDMRARLNQVDAQIRTRADEARAQAYAGQLRAQYDALFNRVRPQIRRAEDVASGVFLTTDEITQLVETVERELEAIEPPWDQTSLPHAIRGWVLCQLGRTADGEKELEIAAGGGRENRGDPYGIMFQVRWKTQRLFTGIVSTSVTFRLAGPTGPSVTIRKLRDTSEAQEPLRSLQETIQNIHTWPGWGQSEEAASLLYLLDGVRAFTEGRYAEAEAPLKRIAGHPELGTQAVACMAICRMSDSDFEGSVQAWSQLLRDRPEWKHFWHRRAVARVAAALSQTPWTPEQRSARLREALKDFEQALTGVRDALGIYSIRAITYRILALYAPAAERVDLLKNAVADYGGILLLSPSDGEALFNRGSAHRQLANEWLVRSSPDQARKSFESSLADIGRAADRFAGGEREPGCLYERGLTSFGLGAMELDWANAPDRARAPLERAVQDFKKSRELGYADPDLLMMEGNVRLRLSPLYARANEPHVPMLEEALANFDDLVKRFPERFGPYLGRAFTHWGLAVAAQRHGGDAKMHFEATEADAKLALQYGPTSWEAHDLQGQYLHRVQKRPHAAVPFYEKAIQLRVAPDPGLQARLKAARDDAAKNPEDF